MAMSNTEMLSVWRALPKNASAPGWRSIDLFHNGTIKIKIARHAPGDEEAVLIGFASVKIAPTSQLPQGRGFRIEKAVLSELSEEHQWLAIIRQPAGCLELFAAVVTDVCDVLRSIDDVTEQAVYQRLLGRVRGWQEFMRRGRDGLPPEVEQGLIGELCFLRYLLDEGMVIHSAVEGWKGPFDGLHDFELGVGAIEVKSTLATEGFPVSIACLEQLDDAKHSQLFIAALRLSSNGPAQSLPEYVADIRHRVEPDPAAMNLLERALHSAGYLDMHSESYTRQLSVSEIRIYHVDNAFPKLTPSTIPTAIRRAQYEIDLALLSADVHQLNGVLTKLGAI